MKVQKIVTHDGKFHTDEVFGTALLLQIYNIKKIIRTRDKDILSAAKKDKDTVVIDVGMEYDPVMNNFDHHQNDFNETFSEEYSIPMSSCGLIWKNFGKKIISAVLSENLPDKTVEKIHQKMYRESFLSVDANDNGIKMIKNHNDVVYNYFYNITLENIIGCFNFSDCENSAEQTCQFNKAVIVCSQFFREKIKKVKKSITDYENNLLYFSNVFEEYRDKKYIYLEKGDIYHGSYINEFDKDEKILFFISKRNDTKYKIYTRKKRGYDMIAPLITETDAKKIVGEDLNFIHRERFTGSCKTFSAAVKIVENSIEKYQKKSHLSIGSEIDKRFEGKESSVIFLASFLFGAFVLFLGNI